MLTKNRKDGYIYRKYEQLIDWMNGKSKHNYIDDECCPDFTCCTNIIPDNKEAKQIVYNFFMEENLNFIRDYKIKLLLK
jgi:hypothetical protein